MSERPAKCVDVNENDSNNTTCWCAGYLLGVGACESQIQSQVQHRRGLHGCTDNKRKTSTDSVDKEGNVENCSHKFDHSIDSSSQQARGAGLDTDELEDFWGIILYSQLVKEFSTIPEMYNLRSKSQFP